MREITDIKEIQTIQIEILKYFKKVCEENELEYYLSNGTLLGAVKYKKFIPWDDDIDVIMPREDYDRLVNTVFIDTDTIKLISDATVSEWRQPYSKLCDMSTRMSEGTQNRGVELGLAIDIFPLDAWYGSKRQAIKQAKYCGLMRRFMSASSATTFSTPKRGLTRVILFLIWIYSQIRGTEHFRKRILRQIGKGKRCVDPLYIGCVAWCLYGKKEVISRKAFRDSVIVEFEGEKYPAPKGYNEYLRSLYGDYEKDPPIEKQRPHHSMRAWRIE